MASESFEVVHHAPAKDVVQRLMLMLVARPEFRVSADAGSLVVVSRRGLAARIHGYGYRYAIEVVESGEQTRLRVVVTPNYGIGLWRLSLCFAVFIGFAAYWHEPMLVPAWAVLLGVGLLARAAALLVMLPFNARNFRALLSVRDSASAPEPVWFV